MENIDAFPLSWPIGWKRSIFRKTSKFSVTFAKARDELFQELRRMGVLEKNIILSTNIQLRLDGLPYAGRTNPSDPGVAVYFQYKKKAMVFACDTYRTVTENLWAVKKTIEALRGIERWGASDMLERSFAGFEALPAPAEETWHSILKCSPKATHDEIRAAWKEQAKLHHPDQGGSTEMMTKINNAYHQGIRGGQ